MRRLVIAGALLCAWAWTPPAAADCGAPRRVIPVHDGAITGQAVYKSTLPGGAVSLYDITLHNTYGAWYFLRLSHPTSGGCWPWGGDTRHTYIAGLPPGEFIGPNETLSFDDVPLRDGDRFAFCHVGLNDNSGHWFIEEADLRAVALINALDIIGLGLFGEEIGSDLVHWSIEDSLTGIVLELVDAVGGPLQAAELDAMRMFSQDDVGFWDVAEAAWSVSIAFLREVGSGAMVTNVLRRLGVRRAVTWSSRLLGALAFVPNVVRMLRRYVDVYRAYTQAPWGYVGFDVVAAPLSGDGAPSGQITSPREGETVGNSVAVSGVATDDCAAVQYVNLTYTTDNWATWHYVGQDASAPYGFTVNLSAVPDGTTVKFGWDVYDTTGHHADSPRGNRTVTKNAAALAPPRDDAAYVADVNYPDGTVVSANVAFNKTWRIRNSGTSSWTAGYRLAHAGGTNLAAVSEVALPALGPGQTGDVTVAMRTPVAPGEYVSYWRPKNPGGTAFGSTVWVLIEVRCESPDCGSCAASDRCLNMGCSAHNPPADGVRFKTPATGPGVYYGRGGYKHPFPDSVCYFLFYDAWTGLQCIANDEAAALTTAPYPCRSGSFLREEGDSTIYRLESDRLRPLCGIWTNAQFRAQFGHPFDVALLVDEEHWPGVRARYPLGAAIYPTGSRAPACGDPGYECGTFVDPDVECFGSLTCTCPAAADCVSHRCVTREPEQTLVAGRFVSPEDGEVVPNQCFDVQWEPGYASDGAGTQTALYCETESGTWDLRAGFGFTPPYTVCDLPPGSDFTCKLRTRLAGDYGTWVDGTPVTWHVNADWARMVVTGAVLEFPEGWRGCDDLLVRATVRNEGDQEGDWRLRAYYHAAGEDEFSPDAIQSYRAPVVPLAPGQEAEFTLPIALDEPLPLAAGTRAVTVIVDDPYHAFAGPASRRTVSASGVDHDLPVMIHFGVTAHPGEPPWVVPGRTHAIVVAAEDGYALDRFDVRWRPAGGTWRAIRAGDLNDTCRDEFSHGEDWTVPDGFAHGDRLEISARVWDVGGHLVERSMEVQVLVSTEPELTFLRPTGGESYVQATNQDPECVPVDLIFAPGNQELVEIRLGFSTGDHGDCTPLRWITQLPQSGVVSDCLSTQTVAGDDLVVCAELVERLGEEHRFYSPGIAVAFRPPEPPWGPVVVDTTQHILPGVPDQYGWPGSSEWRFFALRPVDSQLLVHREDHRSWSAEDGQMRDEYTLTRLSFALDDLSLASESTVLASHEEPRQRRGVYEIEVALYDDWFLDYDENPLDPDCVCSGPEGCDFEPRVREVRNGALTPWDALDSYPDRGCGQGPVMHRNFGNAIVGAQGLPFLFVENHRLNEYNNTNLYRRNGGDWGLLTTIPLDLKSQAVADGRLWGLGSHYDTGAGCLRVSAHSISEQDGTTGTPVPLFCLSETPYYWISGADLTRETIVAAGMELNRRSLYLARARDGMWETLPVQALPDTWRGQPLSMAIPSALHVDGDSLHLEAQLNAGDRSVDLLIEVVPGQPPDIDHAAILEESRSPMTRAMVPVGSGGFARAFACSWNLEPRLCLQKSHPGAGSCYDADPCTADEWDPVAGVCNYPPIVCQQDGDACNGPEVCDPATGTCLTDPEQAPACDDGDPCNGRETCDAATGDCVPGAPPALDDGFACTDDACAPDGTVGNTPNDARCAGDACTLAFCRPDDPAADPETGCVETPRPVVADGLPCTQDGCNPLNGAPVYGLLDGYCLIDGACVTADTPEPANPCAACAPERSSVAWSPAAEGAPCDDGQFCTETDACVQGACMGRVRACDTGTEPTCGGSRCDESADACLPLAAEDGTPCDDFDLCNGRETCAAGRCTNGLPPDLSAPGPCIERVCDALEGVIEQPSVGPCDDNDPCTTGDTCTDGACAGVRVADCCVTAADCNDGDPCTLDRCEGQRCRHDSSPVCACTQDAECTNGDPCDGSEACVAGTCQAGALPDCDDHDPCTDDACVAGVGCQHAAHERDCDDGNACTTDDRCMSGACLGWPRDCDDANPCTADSCEPLGGCTHAPQDGLCDDADPCSETACRDGVCSIVGRVAGCCSEDAHCALPAEMCVDGACAQVLCTPCAQDAQCGAEWNRCMQLPSGRRCLVDCEDAPESCPAGAHCERFDEGHAQCLPDSGDCECTPRVGVMCDGDRVVFVDSCGRPGEQVMTCEGRGCVDGACCPVGDWAQDGMCVARPGPDAGGQPVDAAGMPDSRDAAADTAHGDAVTGPGDVADAGRTDGSPASPDGGTPGGGGGCAAGMAGAAPSILWFAAGLLLALPTTRRRAKRPTLP